jgi:hypothetical protein
MGTWGKEENRSGKLKDSSNTDLLEVCLDLTGGDDTHPESFSGALMEMLCHYKFVSHGLSREWVQAKPCRTRLGPASLSEGHMEQQ